MNTVQTPMIRYRYDALDLLIQLEPLGQEQLTRIYRGSHLVTQLKGRDSQSVFQHDTQLLAMQSREGDDINSQLLATDQQRSVLQAGSVSQAYAPYGHRRVEGGLGSLLGFTGEVIDPVTGHYLLGNGHRAFNPVLMRFNSPDSLSPFGRGGLNAYAYCLGDPVNFSDPTGRFAEFARLFTSLLSTTNTRVGMSRVIPSYNLAKDALQWGAAGQLTFRQTFAAASTVVASGAIFVTALTGIASAVAGITGDTEAAKTLGFIALGLTALASVSRLGTYLAARDPTVEAGLSSFVQNKRRVIPATPPISPRASLPPSLSFEASAPPQTPGTFSSNQQKLSGKRSYDEMLGLELNRPVLEARRQRLQLNQNKRIRRT